MAESASPPYVLRNTTKVPKTYNLRGQRIHVGSNGVLPLDFDSDVLAARLILKRSFRLAHADTKEFVPEEDVPKAVLELEKRARLHAEGKLKPPSPISKSGSVTQCTCTRDTHTQDIPTRIKRHDLVRACHDHGLSVAEGATVAQLRSQLTIHFEEWLKANPASEEEELEQEEPEQEEDSNEQEG